MHQRRILWPRDSQKWPRACAFASTTTETGGRGKQNWLKHRNPFRYFRYLYFLFTGNSVVLVRSAMNVLILGGWALLICIHNTARPEAVLQCDPIPLTLLGAFVSLLLVFRTNSSYARFAEARLLLGQLVLHTREFSRLAVLHFPLRSQRKRALAYIIAFAWCLKARVRMNDNPARRVVKVLGPREATSLLKKTKPAFFALQELSKMVANNHKKIPGYALYMMEMSLKDMDRVLGGCERIISTPIPLSYTRHTSRSLLLFLIGLPFVLWPLLGWGTVFFTLVASFIIIGIDETGLHIEEPFGVMPLQPLCEIVEATMNETLEEYGH